MPKGELDLSSAFMQPLRAMGSPIPIPEPILPPEYQMMADTMCDRLEKAMADFQDSLAADEELGACVAHFGNTVMIHVDNVGYHNPHLIILYGRNEQGDRVRLLQHLNQVNLLLVAVKPRPGEAPRRIGFHREEAESEP